MKRRNSPVPARFSELLSEIKSRIQDARARAVLSANSELIRLYWDIGRLIDFRQQKQGWGAAVIPRLAKELRNSLPEEKGFSERNIKRMLAFYRAYPDLAVLVPQPVAQSRSASKVPQLVAQNPLTLEAILWLIPWGHHALLMDKVESLSDRVWYMAETLANGWSRNSLLGMIRSGACRRKGKAITNFARLLPGPQSDLIQQSLKDPYVFDFLTLDEPFQERELEINLLQELERFLLELGQGFAFVGRQIHVVVGDQDFFIDLLFYHLRLRCYVVIDLKKGPFKPEYAGKMNFYLAVVDEKFRHATDAPSIGLILCQDRNQVVAEYALRGMTKPIGVSEYELTRALPKKLRSALPTIEQIEAELATSERAQNQAKGRRRK